MREGLGTASSPACPAWDLVQNLTAPQRHNFHGDKREPQHCRRRVAGALAWHLPSAACLLELPTTGWEVAASCFAHLQDQLGFFTHIFLQPRVSRGDVLMITGQAAASPQLPLVLTSRGCSRALEGHLREADAGRAAWEEATMPCSSSVWAGSSASLLQPLTGGVWGVEEGRSHPHILSAASPISLHISCSFLCS